MPKHIKKTGLLITILLILFVFGIYQANSAPMNQTKSCWSQGFRSLSCPKGGCTSCKDTSNNRVYYKKNSCNTAGYIKSCPIGTGQTLNPATKLDCNNSYSKDCTCSSVYKYGQGRSTCSTKLSGASCTIGGKTFYKNCECPVQYSKTCNLAMGQVPVNANDGCGEKYTACKCTTPSIPAGQTCTKKISNGLTCYIDCKTDVAKTCETEGYVTACPAGQTGAYVKADNGKLSCYTGCVVTTCANGGYLSSIPANQKCTTITYARQTCYKDCVAKTCDDGGFYSDIPSNEKCTAVTYAGLTCQKDCYRLTCADGGYLESIPTNQTCTSVAYAGLTCQKNCTSLSCSDMGEIEPPASSIYYSNNNSISYIENPSDYTQICILKDYGTKLCYKQSQCQSVDDYCKYNIGHSDGVLHLDNKIVGEGEAEACIGHHGGVPTTAVVCLSNNSKDVSYYYCTDNNGNYY